jgi:hypothetical protein
MVFLPAIRVVHTLRAKLRHGHNGGISLFKQLSPQCILRGFPNFDSTTWEPAIGIIGTAANEQQFMHGCKR